jgi:hypothetical protein
MPSQLPWGELGAHRALDDLHGQPILLLRRVVGKAAHVTDFRVGFGEGWRGKRHYQAGPVVGALHQPLRRFLGGSPQTL